MSSVSSALTWSEDDGAVLHSAVHHGEPGEHGEGGQREEPVGEGGPGDGTGDVTAPGLQGVTYNKVHYQSLVHASE